MRPNELRNRINAVLAEGVALGVLLDFQPHVLEGPLNAQILSPANSPGMVPMGISVLDYVRLLDGRLFSAMFDDYALAIVECLFNRGNLIKHRYSYIPCPVDGEEMRARPGDVAVSDWVLQLATAKPAESFRSLGTYRFDYAPEQASRFHPVSHFTFASAECRMPVRAALSIADFLNFLFDNFYQQHVDFWRRHAPFLSCYGIEDDTITLEQMIRHHLNWAVE